MAGCRSAIWAALLLLFFILPHINSDGTESLLLIPSKLHGHVRKVGFHAARNSCFRL